MADCANRNASSRSPRPMAAWAWVNSDSTVIGGSGWVTLVVAAAGLAGAAKAGLAASSRAIRTGIGREIMRQPYVILAGSDYASFAAQAPHRRGQARRRPAQ